MPLFPIKSVAYLFIVVSDALLYSPDKCTIIATYKKLVVGVAFLSSPQETYITYLAVRAGWENAQIATYARPPSSLFALNSNAKATTTLQDDALPPHHAKSTQRYHATRLDQQPRHGQPPPPLYRLPISVHLLTSL